jgi:hypothetical protein
MLLEAVEVFLGVGDGRVPEDALAVVLLEPEVDKAGHDGALDLGPVGAGSGDADDGGSEAAELVLEHLGHYATSHTNLLIWI